MKRFFTSIAIISLLVACGEKAPNKDVDYAVISGKASSPLENEGLYLIQNDEIIKEIPVLPDGTFRDTIKELGENHFYYLMENSLVQTPLYLDKGTNLEITLNEDPTKIAISGTDTKRTQYLIEKNAFINEKINGADSNLFGQKPQEFKENIRAFFKELDSKLKSYNFDEEFVKNQEKWANYKFVDYLIVYPQYHNLFSGTTGKEAILPDDFFAERDSIDYDNGQEYALVDSYRDLVRNKYYDMVGDPGDPAQMEAFLNTIGELKSNNIREDFARGLLSYIKADNPLNKKLLDFINKNVADQNFKDQAKMTFDFAQKLATGSNSPKFVGYENINGGVSSLDDFKGKVVYIDVWATWCKPCIEEIPALKGLEAKFHGKNIEFISISVDDNQGLWKNFVQKRELKGVQLRADKSFESSFIKEYNIQKIPTFIILDKNGKIVNSDAPRPSSPEIVELLEKLL